MIGANGHLLAAILRVTRMRFVCVVGVCLVFAAGFASLSARSSAAATERLEREQGGATRFTCAMHPAETSPVPGSCRICRMALVDAATLDLPPYTVELSVAAGQIVPKAPFMLKLLVREPGGGAVTARFDLVHEMWYHLFIVNEDMTSYQHLHPELQPDLSWTVEVTLPTEGRYSVLSDFAPTGGAAQFLRNTIATAGFAATNTRVPRLAPDIGPRTSGGLAVALAMSPSAIATGQLTRMTYRLTDSVTGEPARDLQPYLGAFGHTLVVREGVTAWIHSHPADDAATVMTPRSRGGPEVSFDAWFTEPGRYRAWTQFMRGGELRTVSFTFDVTAGR